MFCRIALLGITLTLVAAAHAQTTRILLVGDSWTGLQWNARVFRDALQNAGLGQYQEASVAVGGSTAEEWATNGTYLSAITNTVTNEPAIDIFFIQLGGNDYLGESPRPSTALELDPFIDGVWDDIQVVVDHIQTLVPDAKIVYSNYDYINDGDGSHLALEMFGEEAIERASADPNLFYLNTLGLSHHLLGVPGEFGPGERPAPGGFPGYVPLAGGDVTVPGNSNRFDDTIHYTDAMYLNQAELAVEQFIGGFLGGDSPVTISGAQNVEEGARLELTVDTSALTPPLAIAWTKDGSPLAGEAGTTLVRDPATSADSGAYTVMISAATKGTLESASFVVSVLPSGALPVAGGVGLGAAILSMLVLGAWSTSRKA